MKWEEDKFMDFSTSLTCSKLSKQQYPHTYTAVCQMLR